MKTNCLKPIINSESKVIILGSMPGVESIKNQKYYSHSKNQFWKLIYSLFNKEADRSYEEKCSFLLNNRIAIWDVLKLCYREGSLDCDIKDEVPNDFSYLLNKYENIKYIFFNGKKAEYIFNKHIKLETVKNIKLIKLSSSSPTPGRYVKSFDDKKEEWKIILKALNKMDV